MKVRTHCFSGGGKERESILLRHHCQHCRYSAKMTQRKLSVFVSFAPTRCPVGESVAFEGNASALPGHANKVKRVSCFDRFTILFVIFLEEEGGGLKLA